ncbi:MAG: MogA/MoaB family molybdenum cofactor biosynthesis protein [Tepidiformaceae bacterium]
MVRVAILTASDRGAAGDRADVSGDTIERLCHGAGHEVTARVTVPDDREAIAEALRDWCDRHVADVVITTGGTGLTARDVTPEATRDVAERDVPALPLVLTLHGLQKTPFAALGRGVAVTRGRALIVNLPGSPKAAEEGMEVLLPLLPHIGELLAGPVEHAALPGSPPSGA